MHTFRTTLKYPLLLAVAHAALSTGDVRADDPLNLLFFGNSFTINVNPNTIGQLAVAEGYPQPLIVSDLSGGADIDNHITKVQGNPQNNISHPLINGDTYDYTIIQGHSREATHLRNPNFVSEAVELSNLVLDAPSGAGGAIIFFETWAYEAGNSSYYPSRFSGPEAMQAEIRDGYNMAKDAVNDDVGWRAASIAPVGDAFEQSNFYNRLYAGDLVHPSVRGSSLGSLVLYRTIYMEQVSDIPYSEISGIFPLSQTEWGMISAWADAVPILSVPEPTAFGLLAVVLGACLGSIRHERRLQ